MFYNKFIACISVEGDIVREDKHNVYLPYGTEFSLFFKNIGEDLVNVTMVSFHGSAFNKDIKINQDDVFEEDYKFKFEEDCELTVHWKTIDSFDNVIEQNGVSFFLKGVNEVEQISEVSTVKSKKVCSSCGKKFKSSYNYCPYDGTYLNNE